MLQIIILLSAVAGAVIQQLIDNNCQVNSIFENGCFIIKNDFIKLQYSYYIFL